MSTSGPLVAAASGVAWSTLDVARKYLTRHLDAAAAAIALAFTQLPIFATWYLLDPQPIGAAYFPPAAALVASNTVASLLFLRAVAVSPLSLTIPYLALTPVFAFALGAIVLGELPAPAQLTGIAVIVAGALALNPRPQGATTGLLARWRAYISEPGSVMMTAVAVIWGLNTALDKIALTHAPPAFHGLVQNAGVGLALLIWLASRRRLRDLTAVARARTPLAFAAIAAAVALGLQLIAIQLTLVSLVEAIKRAIGLALAVLLGRLLFGEAITSRKIAATVAIAIGTALVL